MKQESSDGSAHHCSLGLEWPSPWPMRHLDLQYRVLSIWLLSEMWLTNYTTKINIVAKVITKVKRSNEQEWQEIRQVIQVMQISQRMVSLSHEESLGLTSTRRQHREATEEAGSFFSLLSTWYLQRQIKHVLVITYNSINCKYVFNEMSALINCHLNIFQCANHFFLCYFFFHWEV